MLDLKQSPNFHKNHEGKYNPNCDIPCIVCGKLCSNPTHYVRLFWGFTVVTDAEAQEIIAREGSGGDLLYYPVGNSCFKSYPEIQPYVKDAAETMARFETLEKINQSESAAVTKMEGQINILSEILDTLANDDDAYGEPDSLEGDNLKITIAKMKKRNAKHLLAMKKLRDYMASEGKDTSHLDSVILDLEKENQDE